jgi:hypothetical protein
MSKKMFLSGYDGKKNIKHANNGEIWSHLQLIEGGATAPSYSYGPAAASVYGGPPSNISVSYTCAEDSMLDDVTMGMSTVFSTPTANYRSVGRRAAGAGGSRSGGGSRTGRGSVYHSMPPPSPRNGFALTEEFSAAARAVSPYATTTAGGTKRLRTGEGVANSTSLVVVTDPDPMAASVADETNVEDSSQV